MRQRPADQECPSPATATPADRRTGPLTVAGGATISGALGGEMLAAMSVLRHRAGRQSAGRVSARTTSTGMANTSSARKATRKIARRTEINKGRRSKMRGFVRKVEEAIASGDRAQALAAPEGSRAGDHALGAEGHRASQRREPKGVAPLPSRREARQLAVNFAARSRRRQPLSTEIARASPLDRNRGVAWR